MNKPRTIKTDDLSGFIDSFQDVISAFRDTAEAVMTIITGSFDRTEERSEEISELFSMAKTEAEAIFSVFAGIASLFAGGGGGILESLIGLIPGGGIITSIIGQGLSPSGMPAVPGNFNSSVPDNRPLNIHVHTQIEKPDAVKLGKMINEEAGLRKVKLFTYNN